MSVYIFLHATTDLLCLSFSRWVASGHLSLRGQSWIERRAVVGLRKIYTASALLYCRELCACFRVKLFVLCATVGWCTRKNILGKSWWHTCESLQNLSDLFILWTATVYKYIASALLYSRGLCVCFRIKLGANVLNSVDVSLNPTHSLTVVLVCVCVYIASCYFRLPTCFATVARDWAGFLEEKTSGDCCCRFLKAGCPSKGGKALKKDHAASIRIY